MGKEKSCKTKTLSKETFKKLFLLYVISQFQKGVFGKKRLHKIIYIIERESEIKPYEFKKYFYGQYSEPMDDIQDQLLSMGYIVATPLKTDLNGHSGNIYELADKNLADYYSVIMENIDSTLTNRIKAVINEYGYLKEKELVEKTYSFPEFVHTAWDNIIHPERIPDCLKVGNISDDDVEELEISLNPNFINLLNRIDNAFEQTKFNPDKVRKVVELI